MEFHELQQIVESNARSIQSLADRISELTHDIGDLKDLSREAIEERAELRRATLGMPICSRPWMKIDQQTYGNLILLKAR